MRRVMVDFHNMVDSVVPVPLDGQTFSVGEKVIVFDEDTEDYCAQVISISRDTVFVKITNK